MLGHVPRRCYTAPSSTTPSHQLGSDASPRGPLVLMTGQVAPRALA